MELTATIEALKFASQPSTNNYLLFTDSEYVMKGMTEWIHKWQKKNWKTAGRKLVLNQDLWQRLLAVTADKKIDWKYVAGHSGMRLNERADTIATTFADGLAPNLYNGSKDKYK